MKNTPKILLAGIAAIAIGMVFASQESGDLQASLIAPELYFPKRGIEAITTGWDNLGTIRTFDYDFVTTFQSDVFDSAWKGDINMRGFGDISEETPSITGKISTNGQYVLASLDESTPTETLTLSVEGTFDFNTKIPSADTHISGTITGENAESLDGTFTWKNARTGCDMKSENILIQAIVEHCNKYTLGTERFAPALKNSTQQILDLLKNEKIRTRLSQGKVTYLGIENLSGIRSAHFSYENSAIEDVKIKDFWVRVDSQSINKITFETTGDTQLNGTLTIRDRNPQRHALTSTQADQCELNKLYDTSTQCDCPAPAKKVSFGKTQTTEEQFQCVSPAKAMQFLMTDLCSQAKTAVGGEKSSLEERIKTLQGQAYDMGISAPSCEK